MKTQKERKQNTEIRIPDPPIEIYDILCDLSKENNRTIGREALFMIESVIRSNALYGSMFGRYSKIVKDCLTFMMGKSKEIKIKLIHNNMIDLLRYDVLTDSDRTMWDDASRFLFREAGLSESEVQYSTELMINSKNNG